MLTFFSPEHLRKAVFFLFCSFAFCTAFSIAAAQIAFGLSLTAFLALLLAHQEFVQLRDLSDYGWAVGLFIIWLLLSAALSPSPLSGIGAIREHWLFLIVPVGYCLSRDHKNADQIVLAFGAGLLLASLYGLIQQITGRAWFRGTELEFLGASSYRLQGFFSHTLTYGNYLAISIVFLACCTVGSFKRLCHWKRIGFSCTIVVALAALALTNARGPAVAAAIGLIGTGFVFHKFKYVLIALILFAGVATPGWMRRTADLQALDPKLVVGADRLIIWDHCLTLFKDHPLFGVGPGRFGTEYQKLAPDPIRTMPHAHNDFIHIATVAGLPGLILFIVIWVIVLRRFRRRIKGARPPTETGVLATAAFMASIAFLVSGLTETTFADEEVRQLLMLIWGIGWPVSRH